MTLKEVVWLATALRLEDENFGRFELNKFEVPCCKEALKPRYYIEDY